MRGSTFTSVGTFFIETCFKCGVSFAMTQTMNDQRLKDGENFFCPNGHGQHYTTSMATRLRLANDALAAERARHDQTRAALEHSHASQRVLRGHATRLRKRAAAGVCPCCNRSFGDLRQHMASKHPKYAKEAP